MKRPETVRPWRVRALDREGRPLRPSFGFRHKLDARRFGVALRGFPDLPEAAPPRPI